MFSISAFGNPLLDITVNITNNDLIKKYQLEENGQKEVAVNELHSLLRDIRSVNRNLSPGGCAQNTLRIIQWLSQSKGYTYMFGGIGCDKEGQELKTLVEKAGVFTKYTEHNNFSTGTCIALTNGYNRSLVACLGAAEHYTVKNYLDTNSTNVIFESKYVYIEAYFLTNRNDIARYLIKCCIENKKNFVFNLCGTYLFETEAENMIYFSKHCNILFGNHSEYLKLGECMNLGNNVQEIALNLCKLSVNQDLKYRKLVIVTNGAEKVFCAHSNYLIDEIEVPTISSNKIIDTTAAGDAFVAGFLYALVHDKKPITALKWGCWSARQIIKQAACSIPEFLPNKILNIS